jgi:hypothetical protein
MLVSTLNEFLVLLSLSALFLHCLAGALRQMMLTRFFHTVAATRV